MDWVGMIRRGDAECGGGVLLRGGIREAEELPLGERFRHGEADADLALVIAG